MPPLPVLQSFLLAVVMFRGSSLPKDSQSSCYLARPPDEPPLPSVKIADCARSLPDGVHLDKRWAVVHVRGCGNFFSCVARPLREIDTSSVGTIDLDK